MGIHAVIGRPTRYTPELAAQILDRIAEGELLVDICADPDMPPSRTVRGWVMDPPRGAESFPVLYARARENWCDANVEKAIKLSEDRSGDRYDDGTGTLRTDNARVTRDRLIVDTVKWMASKIYRRQYGEDGLFAGLAAAAGTQGVKITIETVGAPAIEPKTVDGTAEEA